ncbi:MAG: 7-cyano-7-deazaguanine synthase [Phycisphaerae bacterium]|nr:7-cyano-7-deazaguanine synthase [Phycisphaerae bacterium]
MSDLLAIAAGVYAIDRVVRRNYQNSIRGPARVINVRARVSEPDFWTTQSRALQEILFTLSGDEWTFRFEQGECRPWQSSLLEARDIVCLYSGGLDSLAGLASRLADTSHRVTSVTVLHVGRQRDRVERHIAGLNSHFGRRVFPLFARLALIKPPQLDEQEQSQRCRGFMFAAVGVAAAAALGAERIEVYENGIGSLNVPLMQGMSVGGRTTKGCHPRFMSLMSALGSAVIDRAMSFELPHSHCTKGELVSALRHPDLQRLAVSSFSCIHTSPRVSGRLKHCGICAACIGRRQAFLAAGVADDAVSYNADLLDPRIMNTLSASDVAFLKATLMQVALLREAGETLPLAIERYFRSSDVPRHAESGWAEQTELLHRYRHEWERIALDAAERGVSWSNWLNVEREEMLS